MTKKRKHSLSKITGSAVLVVSLITGFAVSATGNPISDLEQTRGFRKAVTLAGIREHQAAFQDFADANDGIRASGTEGFNESADYVADLMSDAGYEVTRQPFEFAFFEELSPSTLEQVAPNAVTYTNGVDFLTMDYSGSGDVTASVSAVDLVLAQPAAVSSGCDGNFTEAAVGAPIVPDPTPGADFDGFPAGNIALMQRGTCSFGLKVVNAQSAGASAAIIMNQGNLPERTDLFGGTLGQPVGIPAISVSFPFGAALNDLIGDGLQLHVVTDTISQIRQTENVIAETPDGDPNNVVVIGGHLDSVTAGPGINDNGSGSATILEVAQVFAEQNREPRNKLRFMWYGAEESGLLGSEFYVGSLTEDELADIALMLNFDMVGSPNFVRFVYDGDNSAFPANTGTGVQDGPEGSGVIEAVFTDYFGAVFGTASFEGSAPTPFNGRSDYGPFIAEGIPAGGLFTGAEGHKTAQEVIDYGGTADIQYDPCYHQACDTFAGTGGATAPGLGLTGLDQMSDAVAHAVLLFSKRNFAQDPLIDPVAPVGAARTGSGGGLHPASHRQV